MKISFCRTVFFCSLFSSVLSAQPCVWTGKDVHQGAPHDRLSWGGNWLGEAAPMGSQNHVYVFPAADSYKPIVDDNHQQHYRVMSMVFNADAGAYIFRGERFILSDQTFIRNESQNIQTFANPLQFSAVESVSVDTGNGGIHWTGGSTKEGKERAFLIKTGVSPLTLGGQHNGFDMLEIQQGEVWIDATTQFSFPFREGHYRIMGSRDRREVEVRPFPQMELNATRASRVVVDPNGSERMTLVFGKWGPHYAVVDSIPGNFAATLHFDLSRSGSEVRFDEIAEAVRGTQGVVQVATVTDTTGKTGFVVLNEDSSGKGWRIQRLASADLLPKEEAWLPSKHYHVALSSAQPVHVYASGQEGHASPATGGGPEWTTLTLAGSGQLVLQNRYLRAPSILLEEGKGDFEINGLGLGHNGGGYLHAAYAMRVFVWRQPEDGALIINTDYFGAVTNEGDTENSWSDAMSTVVHATLAKTGPGTLVFRSPKTSILRSLYVQEGRMQVEADGFTVTGEVNVYDGGMLGGSGQIGGGGRWVRVGHVSSIEGVCWTPVTIDHGGEIDATPAQLARQSSVRGLQIHGSLLMKSNASMKLDLTKEVLKSEYQPMRVVASDPYANAVILSGDLRLALPEEGVGERKTVLLETNSFIMGMFRSVNGIPLDEKDQVTWTHNGKRYSVRIDYDSSIKDKQRAIVLHWKSEPI